MTDVSNFDPLSLTIGGAGSKSYKSISSLTWHAVPPFAVLTGANGSGKTQLLELLAYKLTTTHLPGFNDFNAVRVEVTGADLGPDTVAFMPNSWDMGGSPAMGVAELRQVKLNLYQQLMPHQIGHDRRQLARLARIEKAIGKKRQNLDAESFVALLPDDFVYMLEEEDVITGIAHVIVAYRLRLLEELERHTPQAEILTKLGVAPWDLIDESLKAAEFPYRVVPPTNTKLVDPYFFQLCDDNTTLGPHDLSSGEKTILRTILWLYNSKHHGRFPKLFLLDEPDAHLHPSMTQQFLTVLKDVLVDRYHVRVIMTTHSPSTVALAPAGSVFEMTKEEPRIHAAPSLAHAISLLTSGLVIVSPGTRFVFVEDETDVPFYKALWDLFTNPIGTGDQPVIGAVPSLVFIPASVGQGRAKTSGGKNVVAQWIEKFDQPPLTIMFRGIIDRDAGNSSSNSRVQVLSRYSFENYLVDPFVVYGLLLDVGQAPQVSGVSIQQGDEHKIRDLNEALLQAIVGRVSNIVQPFITDLKSPDCTDTSVTFTNGKRVIYPAWMIERRGRSLLVAYQRAFGGPGIINPEKLMNSMRRVRLIPVELHNIFRILQSEA